MISAQEARDKKILVAQPTSLELELQSIENSVKFAISDNRTHIVFPAVSNEAKAELISLGYTVSEDLIGASRDGCLISW